MMKLDVPRINNLNRKITDWRYNVMLRTMAIAYIATYLKPPAWEKIDLQWVFSRSDRDQHAYFLLTTNHGEKIY